MYFITLGYFNTNLFQTLSNFLTNHRSSILDRKYYVIQQKSFIMAFIYMIVFHAGKLHVCNVYRKPKVFKLSSLPRGRAIGEFFD
jgi:hypothetical protein